MHFRPHDRDSAETMIKKKYELIILDCDGTLVDSEPLSNRVIAEMLTEIGIPMSAKQAFDRFAGTSMSQIISYIETKKGRLDFDFEERFRSLTKVVFEKELKPIPGVEDFIQALSTPYCVASNGPKRKMAITLKVTGLSRYFADDHIFSAYDIQEWKPSPALFLHAAQRMGHSPDKCLVIEDTSAGAEAAIAAGMDLLLYDPHDEPQLEQYQRFKDYRFLKGVH